MFGGYTDVAAYYMDTSAVQSNGRNSPLPQEYMAFKTLKNPWNVSASFNKDFILIAEFSEQEGPKPLETIPKDIGGSFDLNSFAVRILSVDHHATAGVHCYNSEDTSVVLTERESSVYAYVQHFTLHDSQARGFVRPFCMAFVSSDENKIMKFFEEISSKFEQVSKTFKQGNHDLFMRDMDRYLEDLEYTRERFIQREELMKSDEYVAVGNEEEEKILRGSSLSTIDSFTKEIREIIAKVSRNSSEKLTDSKLQQDCSSETCENEYCEKDYQPKVVRTVNRKRFDKTLRNLQELCNLAAKKGLNQLSMIQKHFKKDLAELLIEKQESSMVESRSSLLTIGGHIAINFMNNINESKDSLKQSAVLSNSHLHNPFQVNNPNQAEGSQLTQSEGGAEYTLRFPCPNSQTTNHPGHGITQFLHNYPCSPRLLYSLLTGMTVVVLGNAGMQNAVEGIIEVLSLFVPMHASHDNAIVWWREDSVKMTDLSHIKLIGLCRHERKSADQMIPETVRPYVTILDVEQKTISAPLYKGQIITSIVNKKKQFKHESTFISYIQSTLLELATKAFAYFHEFCGNPPKVPKSSLSDCYQFCQDVNKAAIDFLSKLGVQEQDAEIVQYFTEIIKTEQVHQFYSCKGYSSSPVLRLNRKPCVLTRI